MACPIYSGRSISTTACLPATARRAPPTSCRRCRIAGQRIIPRENAEAVPAALSFGELHLRMLEQYAPPSVLVNQDYDIIHLSESAGQFLQFGGGEPSFNLLNVVHPDLRIELRTALFRAIQRGRGSEASRVPMRTDGTTRWINLVVRPAQNPQSTQAFVLVIFDESIPGEPAREPSAPSEQEPLARQLDQELQHTKSQLRTTVEQYETSIEELKASNEELQAINEELHSTTEEMETSKEELQSINEELHAVNQELKNKIDEVSPKQRRPAELHRRHRDRHDLPGPRAAHHALHAKRGGAVQPDPDRIRRPLPHITHRSLPDLAADTAQVLEAAADRARSGDDGRPGLSRAAALPHSR